jgi:predicted short-subunit dehydrogenase-like oxidoreductase (DUF2520 family)
MTGRTIAKTIITKDPTVAIVGAGSLASSLALALHEAGFKITEIVARNAPPSLRKARALAARVGARAVTANSAALDASLLWFCVPDREIRGAASALAASLTARTPANHKSGVRCKVQNIVQKKAQKKVRNNVRFALHSSGALPSRELDPLRQAGLAVASVHPLMTFVADSRPSLQGVPFAIEGDDAATRVARHIVRQLGGESFHLPAPRKAAYHAWATMTSPLLLAFLVTLEDAASAAGFTRNDARRQSLPIIRQTLANYARLGPARSFSGPLVRGDAATVAQHLAALKKHPGACEVYLALAQSALRNLPVKNREKLKRLLRA